ncbi:MAG: acylphosphatase, partial [Thermoanaerobaculia bacterium]
MPPGTRRVHLFIGGRVQGVGFRAYTEGEARRLKLEGFVKNLPDGRVEA